MKKFMRRYARANFANATEHERVMVAWLVERDNRWTSQPVWGHSIMDCWHPIHRVCIEVDGKNHRGSKQMTKDAKRDSAMAKSNIKVLRVTNEQVDNGEAFCLASELMGYEWRADDFHRPMWSSPYEQITHNG